MAEAKKVKVRVLRDGDHGKCNDVIEIDAAQVKVLGDAVDASPDKVVSDVVTISNGSTFTMEKKWNGATWDPTGVVIDGGLIVTGSVTSSKIDTRGLSIKDAQGNVILAAGSALNQNYAAPGTLNSDLTPAIELAATTATYLAVPDTRSVNTPPSGYAVGHIKEFKQRPVLGLGDTGYCVLETIKGWYDNSGGDAMQWAYIGSSEVWKRSGGNADSAWGPWVRDLDRALYTGDLNATVGAPSGTPVGGTEAGLVASRALNGDSAFNALPGISSAIADKLSKTGASDLAARVTLATGGAILAGTPTNGSYHDATGFYGVQGGTVKFSVPTSGDPTFGGNLTAAYGTFGALRVASGGYIAQGDYTGAWAWPAGSGTGWLIHPNGLLFGNATDPSKGFFQLDVVTSSVIMPGFSYAGRQLTLDGSIIINPKLPTFTVSVTNSINQYDWIITRLTTDGFAGVYAASVSGSSNNTAAYDWSVSGPWPCWLVSNGSANQMQLHINMKAGGAVSGDAGDFFVSCTVNRDGVTQNTQRLVTVTAQ
jgi:hypothetical protein